LWRGYIGFEKGIFAGSRNNNNNNNDSNNNVSVIRKLYERQLCLPLDGECVCVCVCTCLCAAIIYMCFWYCNNNVLLVVCVTIYLVHV